MADDVSALVEACKDSAKGYRLAAEKVKEPDVREIFLRISRQRVEFVQGLQAFADGSSRAITTPDAVQRGWEGLESAIPVEHDVAVLDEVERGEDATLKVYEQALAADLSSDLRAIVDEQYWEVRKDHDRIRSLRDSHWKMEVPMAGLQ